MQNYSNLEKGPQCKRFKIDTAECTENAEDKSTNTCPVKGIVIALCCHHRCDWHHYVGRDFFQKLGLGQREFGVFQRMSSWATCGSRTPGQVLDSNEKKELEEAEDHDIDLTNTYCSSEGVQGYVITPISCVCL